MPILLMMHVFKCMGMLLLVFMVCDKSENVMFLSSPIKLKSYVSLDARELLILV